MKPVVWALAVLTSHWLRRPFQLAAMVLGLAAATALWSGVQALNAQARTAYERGTAVFAQQTGVLAAADGGRFSQNVYVSLRRSGWLVSPVLEAQLRIRGAPLQLLGVDPATMPRAGGLPGLGDPAEGDAAAEGAAAADFAAFMTPPWRSYMAPETLRDLGLAPGATPRMDNGATLPPVEPRAGLTPGVVILDIGAAQQMLNAPGEISRLLITGEPNIAAPSLIAAGGGGLRQITPDQTEDLERLTASFHLNLTAFGLLAFVVGLFIVYSAAGLAFEQRVPLMRTLRACGTSARNLAIALALEAGLLALLAGAAGLAGGYLIAAALLPDVAATLRGLYGAPVSGGLSLQPQWWITGLGMSLIGAMAATGAGMARAWRLPILQSAFPIAWRQAQQRWLTRQAVLASALFAAGAGFALFGEGLVSGFVTMAALMLGAALALPPILSFLLRLGQRTARGPMAEWFWADARREMSGLSLALMALLLALATNIGVGAMVGGFRQTFTGWLDQRFAADIYLNLANADDAGEIVDWLSGRDDVEAVLPILQTETRLDGWPVEVEGFADDPMYRATWPVLGAPADWNAVARGEAALVNEQLARRLRLARGSRLYIVTPASAWDLRVAGVYADYGNPRGQVRVAADAMAERWPDVTGASFELRTEEGAASGVVAALRGELAGKGVIMDQGAIKGLSLGIFERTFAVTASLNAFTLLIAGAALMANLATIANRRLPQLAPAWAIGATRRTLARMELGKTLALAGLTAALAVPLGIAIAWLLVAVVQVEAFGWRLPLHVFPLQWAQMFVLALIVALVAAAGPALRLARMQPARLARVFADER